MAVFRGLANVLAMTNYYVRQNAKRYGPLTAKVVKQLVAKGKIDREDLIANYPCLLYTSDPADE